VPAADAALQRGTVYLGRTQAEDGTWHVVNRAMKIQPCFEGGFPYEHDQWISHAGTAWAGWGWHRQVSTPRPCRHRRDSRSVVSKARKVAVRA